MWNIKQLDVGKNNNFDILRLFASIVVILSHSYLITGNFASEPFIKFFGFIDLGALGVYIFFTISGYLILKSLFRQTNLYSFVWARILRIFPALFVASLFCVFIGAFCTKVPLFSYLKNHQTFEFIWRLSSLHNFFNSGLPGVFANNPYQGHVDSPIWTLPAEILCYLEVFALGVFTLILKKKFELLRRTIPLIILVLLFFYKKNYPFWYMQLIIFKWGMFFNFGMVFYWLNKKIIISIYLCLFMFFCLLILFYLKVGFLNYVFNIVLIYAIFVVAYHPRLHIPKSKNWGDFSYGLYIYTFPIQQMLISRFHILNPISNFLIALTLTLPLSIGSWYFLEKPLLSLKTLSVKDLLNRRKHEISTHP